MSLFKRDLSNLIIGLVTGAIVIEGGFYYLFFIIGISAFLLLYSLNSQKDGGTKK